MFPFRRPSPSRARRRAALRLETFEERTVPAVAVGVNVNSTQSDQSPPLGNSGAVGPSHYVHFTTGQFTVFNKTGGVVRQVSDTAFWTAAFPAGQAPFLADLVAQPRVVFDPISQRWFAVELTLKSTDNQVLLARSDTADPTGAWKAVNYTATNGATALFGQFPTLAVDANGVYVGTGNFPNNQDGNPVGSTMTSIPKADLLLATPTVANRTQVTQTYDILFNPSVPMGWSPQGVTNFDPADNTASVVATHYTDFDLISYWEITGSGAPNATFGSPTNLTIPHNALPYLARQPDGTRHIYAGNADIYSGAAFQVGDLIYAVHLISVNSSGIGTDVAPGDTNPPTTDAIQLIVIRDSTNTVVTTKTFFNPAYDYTFPSVSANAFGDIVIGFNRSGGPTAVNGNLGAYAIYARIDPANPAAGVTELGQMELQAGLFNAYRLSGAGDVEPWGMYSATGVDPSDPFAFWTTLQYATKNASNESQWTTKVSQVLVSPRALTVSASPSSGTFGAGSVIDITVAFNGPVTVTGNPQLALNSGAAATYLSGSGSNVLTFRYTVGATDSTPDLDYTALGISLNGGTINHVSGSFSVPAELTLPAPGTAGSLGANTNLVIQQGAAATAVSSTNGTFGAGQTISITVTFSRAVTVNTAGGTPSLALNSGGTATYFSGTGSSALVFHYTVGANQTASDLDYTSTGALTLNGGTIIGVVSNVNADLTLPAPGAAGSLGANNDIVIDTTRAVVTNVTSPTLNGTYGVGKIIDVTVQFNRVVNVTGSPQLALNSGGTAAYLTGTGTNTLTFRYTVGSGESAADLDYASTGALTGGTIQDQSGLDANRALPGPGSPGSLGANKALVVDTVGPTVLEFRVLFGSKRYNVIGSTRFDLPWLVTGVQVVFDEPVKTGNVRSLTGLTASRFSGLGTKTLTWNFAGIAKGSFNTALASTGANALKDKSGNPIAAFTQAFKVLYGDFTGDGVVNLADELGVRNSMSAPYQLLNPAGYNLFADLSGDGLVNLIDVGIARTRRGASLP